MQLGTLSFEGPRCGGMLPRGPQRAHNGLMWYQSKESDVR